MSLRDSIYNTPKYAAVYGIKDTNDNIVFVGYAKKLRNTLIKKYEKEFKNMLELENCSITLLFTKTDSTRTTDNELIEIANSYIKECNPVLNNGFYKQDRINEENELVINQFPNAKTVCNHSTGYTFTNFVSPLREEYLEWVVDVLKSNDVRKWLVDGHTIHNYDPEYIEIHNFKEQIKRYFPEVSKIGFRIITDEQRFLDQFLTYPSNEWGGDTLDYINKRGSEQEFTKKELISEYTEWFGVRPNISMDRFNSYYRIHSGMQIMEKFGLTFTQYKNYRWLFGINGEQFFN